MTYSIIARCPRSGQLGVATASYSFAIGRYADGALRANTGVCVTQDVPLPRNNLLAMSLLAAGRDVRGVLAELIANDDAHACRQIALVDRSGAVQVATGVQTLPWAGHRIGEACVVFGTQLAGVQVIDAMAAAFEVDPGADLDARLLGALEAGRDAGGLKGRTQRLPERSSALVVFGNHAFNDIDLRVDLNADPVGELRRIYDEYKPYGAYYDERAKNPRAAVPQFMFADRLNAARKESRP